MIVGKVLRSAKRVFECKNIKTGEHFHAAAKASILKQEHIVVGDLVECIKEEQSDDYLISKVQSRQNEIFRLIKREQKKKVIASNCDLLVIVMAVSKPVYKNGLVDRFLVRAHQWGVDCYLVFNKMDEYSEKKGPSLQFEENRLKNLSVKCFETSMMDINKKPQFLKLGFSDLKKALKGKTSILVGQSGVGKSLLISKLSDKNVTLKSGKLGKLGKGAHTTTWAEIVDCGSFEIIDSPGIRSYSLDDISQEHLIEYFPDLQSMSLKCQFTNCEHQRNSKGCFFYSDEIMNGPNQKEIHSRLNSYLKLSEEVGAIPDWEKS